MRDNDTITGKVYVDGNKLCPGKESCPVVETVWLINVDRQWVSACMSETHLSAF